MTRFFPLTALGGWLYLRDLSDHGTWDRSRLGFTNEETLDRMSPRMLFDRKIRTATELDTALEASRTAPGSLALWVQEDLADVVRERWETQKRAT